MKYLFNKFKYALAGLCYAIKNDRGVQLQLVFFIVSAPILFTVLQPLSKLEIALTIFGYGLLLVTELQNTAFEKALDALHPERHDLVKQSKDIAAGSVLFSLIIFGGIVLTLLVEQGVL